MDLNDALGDWPASGNNNPQQPSNPSWPGQPANPSWPGQPANPSSQPSWPGSGAGGGGGGTWPGQPGQPSQPAWPGQPGQPSQPAWPGQPGQPSQPAWPGQPGQPSPGPGLGPGLGPGPGPGYTIAPQKNMTVPFSQILPKGVHDKLLITIVGTIKSNADKITVDMSTSQDLAFHFNPRFNDDGEMVIVRNSCINKKWGKEERDFSGGFPFVQGQRFEMKILCTNKEYKVAVNNSHLVTYQHRMSNLKSITRLSIYNDLNLSDVRFETLP